MHKTAFAILALSAMPTLTTAAAGQAHGAHSPHAGKEARDIKALSAQEQQDFLAGQGAGFAIPAELNHYPGPRHVLDLAPRLGLSGEQVARVRASYQKMHTWAVALGRQYVESERDLDRGFAEGKIDEGRLRDLVGAVERLRSELRFVHLRAHLQTTALLTPEQVRRYDALRGYAE